MRWRVPKANKGKPLTGPVLDNLTTLHGTVYLTPRNSRTHGWIAVMAANVVLTIYLIYVVKNRYENSQIYTRVDATCRISQVPFPSVIICNVNSVSLNQTNNIRGILQKYGRSDEEINSFFVAMTQLTHFGWDYKVDSFEDIMEILKSHYFTVDTIMEEIHQPCSNLLIYCQYDRKEKKCNEMFQLIKTLEGYCCAFNYAALNDGFEDPFFDAEDDMEFYDDRKVGAIISTSKSGSYSGLTVVFDVHVEDYPPWSDFTFEGARILISDPNDFPETTVLTRYINPGDSMDVVVEPIVVTSDPVLRRIPVEQRNCWFHDEVDLAHTDRYSYETCQTECRMRGYIAACGCVPYKYPTENDRRICELTDIECIHNVVVFDTKEPCPCFLECSDKKYFAQDNILPVATNNLPKNMHKNVSVDDVSVLKVYFGKSTCNCYKKTIIIDFNRLLGTYGGVFSLCLGGSILTFVEITYLLASYVLSALRIRFSLYTTDEQCKTT